LKRDPDLSRSIGAAGYPTVRASISAAGPVSSSSERTDADLGSVAMIAVSVAMTAVTNSQDAARRVAACATTLGPLPAHMLIWIYDCEMARAATTTDVFNAIAEPRRRQLLDLVAGRERPVNDLVDELGLAQPVVSKHLRVLREVGVVSVRDDGRRRLYRLNKKALQPLHDWLHNVEALWAERLDRLEAIVTELTIEQEGTGHDSGT
jgi:DNA-binding transcriptional ArsR family regulator